jgi:hypothetical protein
MLTESQHTDANHGNLEKEEPVNPSHANSDIEANLEQLKTEDAPVIPPEGGIAGWLSIVGCSIGLFCTFGFLNACVIPQTPPR